MNSLIGQLRQNSPSPQTLPNLLTLHSQMQPGVTLIPYHRVTNKINFYKWGAFLQDKYSKPFPFDSVITANTS